MLPETGPRRVSGLIGILRAGGIRASDSDSVKDWATAGEVLAGRVSLVAQLAFLDWG